MKLKSSQSAATPVESELGMHPIVSQVHVDALPIRSILSNQGITINVDHEVDEDEAMILAMGYKQELKREFSLWTVFSVSFSMLGLLPSIAATFDYQQLVIGMSPIPWLVAMIFITTVALSMAEVASAFPCSAGTPYVVSQLSPPKYKSYLTWFTCWTNWLCQITAAPSVCYSCASLILALYSLTDSSYTPSTGHVYGLSTGIQVVCGLICSMPAKWAGRVSSAGAFCNILFLTIVFVMILAGNKRMELNEGVSTKFNPNAIAWSLYNQAEWPQGISFLISFMGVIWAMSGYDSPFHLAEECAHAAVNVPRAIVLTSSIGGLVGFVFMIAIAYTVVDLDTIAADPQGLGQPFVTYLSQIVEENLVLAATSFTVVSSFSMAQSCLLAASRVTYAYSRDGLFPGSNIWKRVSPLTQTPIWAVVINVTLGQLLLLLLFAGDVAIGATFSVGGISGFISFTMPTLLKITWARNTFQPGPWNLGKFSEPIGWLSVGFIALMIPILCFPTVRGKDLTPTEMNWTVLVYFGSIFIVTIWFIVDAHKWYKGPRSNIDEADIVYDDDDAGAGGSGGSGSEGYDKVQVIDASESNSRSNEKC